MNVAIKGGWLPSPASQLSIVFTFFFPVCLFHERVAVDVFFPLKIIPPSACSHPLIGIFGGYQTRNSLNNRTFIIACYWYESYTLIGIYSIFSKQVHTYKYLFYCKIKTVRLYKNSRLWQFAIVNVGYFRLDIYLIKNCN